MALELSDQDKDGSEGDEWHDKARGEVHPLAVVPASLTPPPPLPQTSLTVPCWSFNAATSPSEPRTFS